MESFVRIETCAVLVVVNNSKQTSEEVEEVVKLHSGHRLISVRIQHLCRKFAKHTNRIQAYVNINWQLKRIQDLENGLYGGC